MNKVIAILFAIVCFATSAVSNTIMGPGLWFWVIISCGFVVAVSQFYPMIRGVGAGVALILSIISICAVALGLLAATVGGSFNMDGASSLLLLLFFLIAVLGLILSGLYKRSIRASESN
tara:strand:+ start:576 stop:932 length:357 start_codon:yes stop_codon:yes gene_type:complete